MLNNYKMLDTVKLYTSALYHLAQKQY